jgi:hypothetical protein
MFDATCRGGLGPVREPGGALSRLVTMLDRGAGSRPSKAAQMIAIVVLLQAHDDETLENAAPQS